MINFTFLPYIDAYYDVARSMHSRAGMFVGKGVRTLHLRGPKKGAEDHDDAIDYGRSTAAVKWPEFKTMLGGLERMGEQITGGKIEFGRIFLEMLDVGTLVPWRRLESEYFERFNRLHLALRTNPGAMLYSGCEAIQLLPGQLTRVNVRVPHSAINLGNSPRIHLILDVRKADPVEPKSLGLPALTKADL